MVASGAAFILGRCVPSVCSEEDVEIGFRNFLFEMTGLTGQDLTTIDWNTLACRTVDDTGLEKSYFIQNIKEISCCS